MNEREESEKALEALGISLDDAEEAERKLEAMGTKRYKTTDSRVCICGHGVGRHTVISGVVYCKPARMECPCKKLRPVLDVDDTRPFIRKTSGAGALHALSLGLLSLVKSGKKSAWVVDLACDRCGAQTGDVVPVPVTQNGRATTYATGFDALLCPKCRVEV